MCLTVHTERDKKSKFNVQKHVFQQQWSRDSVTDYMLQVQDISSLLEACKAE